MHAPMLRDRALAYKHSTELALQHGMSKIQARELTKDALGLLRVGRLHTSRNACRT